MTAPIGDTEQIHRKKHIKNFSITSNDLKWLTVTGSKDVTAEAYRTLDLILMMNPKTIVTPKTVAAEIKRRAAMTGGKAIAERSICRHFKMLEGAGHIVKKLQRGENTGKFMGYTYHVYECPDTASHGRLTGDEKQDTASHGWRTGENARNENENHSNSDAPISHGRRTGESINKVRDITSRNAHKQNDKNGLVFIKTKREPGAGRNAPPAPASKKNKTEWIRELIPPEKRKLIKFGMRRDIEKLFPDDEIERLIKNAFSEGKNPPAYIQGAILRKRQSLTKPTSDEAPPPNPKKNPANQYGIETKNGESVGVLWNAFLGETIKTDIEKFNEFLEYNTKDLSKIPEFVDYLRKEKAI